MASFTKCRVCICALDATVGSYDMRELPALAHKFNTCTDLSVDDEERVPSELCQACHDQLEQLYAFRTKCIASDTKWRMQTIPSHDNKKPTYELQKIPPRKVEVEEAQPEQASQGDERKRTKMVFTLDLMHFERVGGDNNNRQTETTPAEEEELDTGSNSSVQYLQDVFKCDICAAQFLNEKRLLTHNRQHGDMPYPCPEAGCERGYSHKHTLTLHMRKNHKLGKEYLSHVCEFCGKVFDTMTLLRNHRFTHKDKSELPFACLEPNCGRRFTTNQLLKIHTMRHAGVKNYTCSYCGVQKTTRTELKIHMNYHTMERTYSCHLCPKICYSSSNLNKHMRTVHVRSRDYACRFCDDSFIQAETRNQHELIHTGEKPHGCGCGKHFRQKAALRAHCKSRRCQRRALEASASKTETVVKAADVPGN